MSLARDSFLLLLEAHRLPLPETEVEFVPGRKYRADYLWQSPMKLIVEREGGLFSKGRAGMAHAMPTAIRRDMAKSNLAQLAGFIVLRYEPKDLASGKAVEDIKRLFTERAAGEV